MSNYVHQRAVTSDELACAKAQYNLIVENKKRKKKAIGLKETGNI